MPIVMPSRNSEGSRDRRAKLVSDLMAVVVWPKSRAHASPQAESAADGLIKMSSTRLARSSPRRGGLCALSRLNRVERDRGEREGRNVATTQSTM